LIERRTLRDLLSSMRKCKFSDGTGEIKTGKKWLMNTSWNNFELDTEVMLCENDVFLKDKRGTKVLIRMR
jgi:hypothetical protein